jgi:DNA-binding GntR family transcriptional regulator
MIGHLVYDLTEPYMIIADWETPVTTPGGRTPDVLQHARELIVTGQVAPGEFLRLERLANDLGVSVTPVREAMVQLRSEGFVEWHHRRGFLVLPLTSADILDIYSVQAFVAGELARRALPRLSPHAISELASVQDRLEEAHSRGSLDQVEALNHDFHRTINVATNSPRLTWMLKASTRFAPRLFFASITGWPEASASQHRDIIRAMRDFDADAAAARMSEHVLNAGHLLAEHFARHRERAQ